MEKLEKPISLGFCIDFSCVGRGNNVSQSFKKVTTATRFAKSLASVTLTTTLESKQKPATHNFLSRGSRAKDLGMKMIYNPAQQTLEAVLYCSPCRKSVELWLSRSGVVYNIIIVTTCIHFIRNNEKFIVIWKFLFRSIFFFFLRYLAQKLFSAAPLCFLFSRDCTHYYTSRPSFKCMYKKGVFHLVYICTVTTDFISRQSPHFLTIFWRSRSLHFLSCFPPPSWACVV